MESKEVAASALPHFGARRVRACCFTEMTHGSLSAHRDAYSPWGVAFYKSFLFNKAEANPVLYLREELFLPLVESDDVDENLLRYMTPLRPRYAANKPWLARWEKDADYTHEREWRSRDPAKFSWSDLAWIYVPSIKHFQRLLPDLYQQVVDAGVEIRVLDPLSQGERSSLIPMGSDIVPRCRAGYDCTQPWDHTNKRSSCCFYHSSDEIHFMMGKVYCRYGEDCHFRASCSFNHHPPR